MFRRRPGRPGPFAAFLLRFCCVLAALLLPTAARLTSSAVRPETTTRAAARPPVLSGRRTRCGIGAGWLPPPDATGRTHSGSRRYAEPVATAWATLGTAAAATAESPAEEGRQPEPGAPPTFEPCGETCRLQHDARRPRTVNALCAEFAPRSPARGGASGARAVAEGRPPSRSTPATAGPSVSSAAAVSSGGAAARQRN